MRKQVVDHWYSIFGIIVTLAFNCVSSMIPTQFETIFPEGFDSQT